MRSRFIPAAAAVCGILLTAGISLALPPVPPERYVPPPTPGQLVVRVYPVGDLAVWRARKDAKPTFDATILIACLKTAAPAESWKDGSIQPFAPNGTLVVNQSVENHEKIARAIMALRKQRGEKQYEPLPDGIMSPEKPPAEYRGIQ